MSRAVKQMTSRLDDGLMSRAVKQMTSRLDGVLGEVLLVEANRANGGCYQALLSIVMVKS